MATYNYNGLIIDSETLTEDDMPTETMKEVFAFCGADVALSLLINMQSCNIQVPVKGLAKIEKKIVLQEYNGTTASIRAIARKFKISESYIRTILKENKINTPSDNQIGLPFYGVNNA